jgi:hypothetical protein
VSDRSEADYRRAAHQVIAATNPIEPLRLIVISDSMWPLLRTGDAIRVQPTEPTDIHVGDVVVVQCGADLITHRLISVDGERWVTRGDNAVFADAPAPRATCLGRVSAIERGIDRIDIAQPRWRQLNRRLSYLSRVQWRLSRWLRLTPNSPPPAIRLAWLLALPFRALTHMLVMLAQAA